MIRRWLEPATASGCRSPDGCRLYDGCSWSVYFETWSSARLGPSWRRAGRADQPGNRLRSIGWLRSFCRYCLDFRRTIRRRDTSREDRVHSGLSLKRSIMNFGWSIWICLDFFDKIVSWLASWFADSQKFVCLNVKIKLTQIQPVATFIRLDCTVQHGSNCCGERGEQTKPRLKCNFSLFFSLFTIFQRRCFSIADAFHRSTQTLYSTNKAHPEWQPWDKIGQYAPCSARRVFAVWI